MRRALPSAAEFSFIRSALARGPALFLGHTMTARVFRLTGFSENTAHSRRRKPLWATRGVRDIVADWKRWNLAERIIAVAILGLFVLSVSTAPALISITPALIGH